MRNKVEAGWPDELDVSTRLTHLLIGAGIGAILALLFTPKSGRELRGDIAGKARKGIVPQRDKTTQLGAGAGADDETARGRASEQVSAPAEVSRPADVAKQAARA